MSKPTTWRKSSASADQSACVEIPGTLDAIRDSKHPEPVLEVTSLRTFIRRVKDRG